ncbi:MAG TPA: GlxA family transcriptional regulator [Methylomirabilota bacterium]|nr:GlxA family transcriptional regulator [Methylomirabilota bacterium]
MSAAPRSLPVWILTFHDVQVLDVTGPLEVFSLANRLSKGRGPRYEVSVLAREAGAVATSSGMPIVAGRGVRQTTGPVDTLVVAGGLGTRAAMADRRLVAWIRRTALRARRVTSVCSGAFLLGEAGLLDGRRATTHWAVCDALQRRYPAARVERDPIFVRDGKVSTSAGVTAGMDLALELVEEDGGRDLALAVARWLVLFLRRPGGQSQFSVQLSAQVAERRGLRDLQTWIADHLDDDLSVPALARRARMSPRNFARAFRREIGSTPAAYVEAQRVEGARRLLETADLSVVEVAAACGFGRAETMHRAFRRGVQVSPGQYRRHFRVVS